MRYRRKAVMDKGEHGTCIRCEAEHGVISKTVDVPDRYCVHERPHEKGHCRCVMIPAPLTTLEIEKRVEEIKLLDENYEAPEVIADLWQDVLEEIANGAPFAKQLARAALKACELHYNIICDETTNTPETIAKGEMHAKIDFTTITRKARKRALQKLQNVINESS